MMMSARSDNLKASRLPLEERDTPGDRAHTRQVLAALAATQAAYYVLTGIWPLASLRTFERVTGPKVDGWLVRTFGVLVAVIGAVLALGAYRRSDTPEVRLLGAGTALGLAVSESVFVARGRISPVYLLDAMGELGFVAGWLALQRLPVQRGGAPSAR